MTTHNRRSFLARLVGGAAALVGIKVAPRIAEANASPWLAIDGNGAVRLAKDGEPAVRIAKGAVTPEKMAHEGCHWRDGDLLPGRVYGLLAYGRPNTLNVGRLHDVRPLDWIHVGGLVRVVQSVRHDLVRMTTRIEFLG